MNKKDEIKELEKVVIELQDSGDVTAAMLAKSDLDALRNEWNAN